MKSNDLAVNEETEYAAICSFFVERCANENDVHTEIHFGHAVNPERDFIRVLSLPLWYDTSIGSSGFTGKGYTEHGMNTPLAVKRRWP
jgi:hypothetical protein